MEGWKVERATAPSGEHRVAPACSVQPGPPFAGRPTRVFFISTIYVHKGVAGKKKSERRAAFLGPNSEGEPSDRPIRLCQTDIARTCASLQVIARYRRPRAVADSVRADVHVEPTRDAGMRCVCLSRHRVQARASYSSLSYARKLVRSSPRFSGSRVLGFASALMVADAARVSAERRAANDERG